MWRELCVAALCVAVLRAADPEPDSRQPRSADTFWISGRYGRSLQSPAAQNDRFFLSSRYGKRSSSPWPGPARERWKSRLLCDCEPRDLDKRSVLRVSA